MSIYIKFVRLFLVDCLFLQLSEIFSAKDRILMLLILRGIVIFSVEIGFLLSVLPWRYSEFIFKHYVELRQVGVSYGVGNRYCAKICVDKQVLCIQ